MDEIARRYEVFADLEARGVSPLYEEFARGVAEDPEMLSLLSGLPRIKQQPNLLLAAARLTAGLATDYSDFRSRVFDHRPAVIETMLARLTQTNEPARCASIYPLLAGLPQPLALIEVGASAGLCLLPDRYTYQYEPAGGAVIAGDTSSTLTIKCLVDGDLPPLGPITIAWRAGIDLNPLNVANGDDVSWLETLIWPEHRERLSRLREAVRIAQPDRPLIVRGDVMEKLPELAASAPSAATLVVFHSATMNYVPAETRRSFVEHVRKLGAHWISQEGLGVFPDLADQVKDQPRRDTATALVALDGTPKAYAAPHGGWLGWISER